MMALAYEHPWWSLVFILAGGSALSGIASAIVGPLAPCRRGTCPRCHGTGSEVRIDRKGAP